MSLKSRLSGTFFAFFVAICSLSSHRVTASDALPIETYPDQSQVVCEKSTSKIFDECSDQKLILNQAIEAAKKSNKSVLIVYGAEWCIWCHVFDKYINGDHSFFNYNWTLDKEKQHWLMLEKENELRQAQAKELNRYVAENFVVAHIEGEFTNGKKVVAETGIDEDKLYYMPFILTVDAEGKYTKHMPPSSNIVSLEKRMDSGEEYRGYDRVLLLEELKKLRDGG